MRNKSMQRLIKGTCAIVAEEIGQEKPSTEVYLL